MLFFLPPHLLFLLPFSAWVSLFFTAGILRCTQRAASTAPTQLPCRPCPAWRRTDCRACPHAGRWRATMVAPAAVPPPCRPCPVMDALGHRRLGPPRLDGRARARTLRGQILLPNTVEMHWCQVKLRNVTIFSSNPS